MGCMMVVFASVLFGITPTFSAVLRRMDGVPAQSFWTDGLSVRIPGDTDSKEESASPQFMAGTGRI